MRLVAGQAEQLPFPDATFDALTFTYLLRYVADPAATLARARARAAAGRRRSRVSSSRCRRNRFWRFWWWLYTRGVLPVAGFADRRARLGSRRPLPRSEHLAAHYRRYPVDWTVDAWRRRRDSSTSGSGR